jgi:hypothetical protein
MGNKQLLRWLDLAYVRSKVHHRKLTTPGLPCCNMIQPLGENSAMTKTHIGVRVNGQPAQLSIFLETGGENPFMFAIDIKTKCT